MCHVSRGLDSSGVIYLSSEMKNYGVSSDTSEADNAPLFLALKLDRRSTSQAPPSGPQPDWPGPGSLQSTARAAFSSQALTASRGEQCASTSDQRCTRPGVNHIRPLLIYLTASPDTLTYPTMLMVLGLSKAIKLLPSVQTAHGCLRSTLYSRYFLG